MLLTPLQSSVAVAVPVSAGAVAFPTRRSSDLGQVITGAWVSVTVIVCGQLLLLPQLSSAVQVRVMRSLEDTPPPPLHRLDVMLFPPLQSSVAVAVPVSAGAVEAVQSTVTLPGQ